MISYTRLLLPMIAGLSLATISACGGSSSSSPATQTAGLPAVPTPPPATQKGCAGRTTDPIVDLAIQTGRVGNATESDFYQDISEQMACSIEDADIVLSAFFGLDEESQNTADTITSITWDPTHDAAILTAAADSVTLLRSNAVTRSDREVQNFALAIAGEVSSTRNMVMGSNPMRNIYRGGQQEGMTEFLKNGMSWLTKRDDLETGQFSVVIAQMSQSFYFPDQIATRDWLDVQFESRVTYNAAGACDGVALRGCLNGLPDLLIISQTGEAENVAETVAAALEAEIPVLYMHHDGGLTSLGAELLPLLGAQYAGDNYWRNLAIFDYDATQHVGTKSDEDQALEKLLAELKNNSFTFNLSECDDKSCPDDHAYTTDVLPVL